ncbi:MAG: helix-turn-helix transcriptional regulator, partial [Acidimicrobiia bacterium]
MSETLDSRMRRLLLLVPYVLRRPGVSVKEVCTQFGISKSQLTQDLSVLFMCGLPGYGPGDLIEAYVDGDQVMIRMADYFSRPLRLTAAEGLILYCGARALSEAGAADEALDRALKRLEEALGSEALERVALDLQGSTAISTIRRALEARRRLHIVYWAGSTDETTERDVDPWSLFNSGGRWYLAGWCHRVDDERTFRLDRMLSVEMLEEEAEIPDDLDPSKYNAYAEGAESTFVVIDLAPHAAAWVDEYYPLESQEQLDDGWIRVRLSIGGSAWLEKLLLRLGPQARVVDPPDLKERVGSLACKVLERYASS